MFKKLFVFMILLISVLTNVSCSSREEINDSTSTTADSNIILNDTFYGENDLWKVKYEVDAKYEKLSDADTDYSNITGNGVITIEYKGSSEELKAIDELSIIYGYGTNKSSRIGSVERITQFYLIDYGTLIDLDYNKKTEVVIEWDGTNKGSEVIILDTMN